MFAHVHNDNNCENNKKIRKKIKERKKKLYIKI